MHIISIKIISGNNIIVIYPKFDCRIDNFVLNIFNNIKPIETLQSKITSKLNVSKIYF